MYISPSLFKKGGNKEKNEEHKSDEKECPLMGGPFRLEHYTVECLFLPIWSLTPYLILVKLELAGLL